MLWSFGGVCIFTRQENGKKNNEGYYPHANLVLKIR
jgi:hypothetical protein